VKNEVGFILPE